MKLRFGMNILDIKTAIYPSETATDMFTVLYTGIKSM